MPNLPFPARPERLIQEVFARCFVDRSVQIGLIPDPLSLVLAGDGSSIRTGASHYGVKVCDCRKNGVFNCDCMRRYSDPQARWGWDSYRQEYFYGYTCYELNAVGGFHNLPVYIRFAQAQRHDSVLGVVALAEFRQVYPELRAGKFVGDSAHDFYSFKMNNYGIPLCPKG